MKSRAPWNAFKDYIFQLFTEFDFFQLSMPQFLTACNTAREIDQIYRTWHVVAQHFIYFNSPCQPKFVFKFFRSLILFQIKSMVIFFFQPAIQKQICSIWDLFLFWIFIFFTTWKRMNTSQCNWIVSFLFQVSTRAQLYCEADITL